MMPKNREIMSALIVMGSLGLWSGGLPVLAQDGAVQTQDVQGPRTDGQIEMDVVHALDAAPSLKNDWITAGTVNGRVTLTGTAASDANRRLAGSIAGKVSGVTNVANNLKVGDPAAAEAASDQPGPADDADAYQAPAQASDQNSGQAEQPAADAQYAYNGAPQAAAPIAPPPPPPEYTPEPAQSGQAQGGQARGEYAPQRQYPQQGQNQQGQYPQEGQYAQQGPEPGAPSGPVTVAPGTLLKVRSSEPLDSKKARIGTPVEFTVVRDVYAGGVLAVPRGAVIRGEVVDAKQAGAVSGSAEVALKLDALELSGREYPLDSTPFVVKSPSKTGRTVGNAIGGALFGALIGGAVGGGGGAAIGAAAGGAGGTAASAASPGPRVWIPAEALMDFHLNAPLTVTPVSRAEALRLAQNAPPPSQRPTLYRRGYYPYGYPPPPPPPGYYRPY
ncbi:MAG TPA: BON domain-containing protein [Acidobacteriaceae bacterium]|nr:BON domain-containing protein [Acidobacteriaceae bacterium]